MEPGIVEITSPSLREAEQRLCVALRRPQPLRHRKWVARTTREVAAARDAIHAHVAEERGETGLMAELRDEAPWLLSMLEQLLAEIELVEAAAEELRLEVEGLQEPDPGQLDQARKHAAGLVIMVQAVAAKEREIIYAEQNQPGALD